MFVKISKQTVIRESANGGIAINILNGEECALNETGLFFMQTINRNQVYDTIELASELVSSFENVNTEELHLDLVDFYKVMGERGFVDISDSMDGIDSYILEWLHIDITTACNERCLHCYIPDGIKDKKEIMSLELFCRIIDEFVGQGGSNLTISGGEPLLHPSIMEMLDYCKSKKLAISFFSNLLVLKDLHIELLSSMNVSMVQTSVYSLAPAIHDGITQIKGSLAKTLKSVEHLLEAGISVQFSCPVMSLNKESVPDLMDYCKRKNIRLRTNSLIIPQQKGLMLREEIERLTLKQNECMLCSMLERDSSYTLERLIQSSNRIEQFHVNPKEFLSSSVCNAGIDHLCVSANGNVYPCSGWDSYKLGNIHEMSLVDIWRYSKPLRLLRQINQQRNFLECLECKALDFCKRCFVNSESENGGELLRVNPRVCREAFLIKDIVEKYTLTQKSEEDSCK